MSVRMVFHLVFALSLLIVSSGCTERKCVCPEEHGDIIFSDDFEDGNLGGWADHTLCGAADSHEFTLLFSEQDASRVLRHEGGDYAGGGNGEFVVETIPYCSNVAVQADIRNVAAYHTTAKAVGLSACLNEESGVQYLAWYCVSGDLFLYKTRGWFACGPNFMAHVMTSPIGVGQEIQMVLRVVGDSISIAVDGSVALSCRDTGTRLPAGRVGLVATAGITFFDNVSVREID